MPDKDIIRLRHMIFRDTHPDIPWTEIVGMRNRLVHVYFDIDLEQVWSTVQVDLPALISQLRSSLLVSG